MRKERVTSPVYRDDDLAAYRAGETPEERDEARVASLAHDILFLREHAKRNQGPRVVVTIAIPWYDLGIERLRLYLHELGVKASVTEQQLESGRYLEIAPIPRQRAHAHTR